MSLRVRCPHKEESYRRGPAVLMINTSGRYTDLFPEGRMLASC